MKEKKKLYFVVETKDSIWWDDLRHLEGAKIKCGEKHFVEIGNNINNPARYIKTKDVEGVINHI